MLNIADVHRRFGADVVLAGVCLDVGAGEVAVVRGANGAGKSTLFEIVAGVLDADAGSVRVDGRPNTDPRARRSIGYAPAAATLPESLFVHEWVDLACALRGVDGAEDVDATMTRFGLEATVDARLSSLSLGQRRRLLLALASLGHPSLLLLDEPTVGLDAAGVADVIAWLDRHRRAGGAILLASHDDDFASALGAIRCTLAAGRIVES
ncbi:MAG: ATP-binding cassette domain-containing protein [Myxococcales bacterium]|nr:ATP-binding cassette domain-containing protein [Myxococcales bacterium]